MLRKQTLGYGVLAGILLSVGLLMPGRSPGNDLSTRPSPRIRHVYIPADEVKIVFEDSSQGVLMSRDEIVALWREAQQREAAAEALPGEALLASAVYEGELDEHQLRLTGRLEVVNWEGPWQTVELAFGGLAIESARLNGQPARLGATADGVPFVVLESVGRFQLDLELSAPMLRRAGDLAATLQLPPAPASELRVRLAPHQRLEVGGSSVPVETPVDDRPVYRVAVDPAGRLPLVVSDRGAHGERGSVWFATSRARGQVEPAGFRWEVTIDLEVFGRATDAVPLRVPEAVEVVQVDSPQLAGWSLGESESGELPIDLTFRQPVLGPCTIRLSGLAPLPLASSWQVPAVRVPQAVSHVGQVGLTAAANLRVEVGELAGLRPEESDHTFGFAFWDENFRLPLYVTERRRELAASVATLVQVRRSGLALRGSVTVTPRYAPLFEVALQLPRTWSVQAVSCDGVPRTWSLVDAGEDDGDGESHLQTLRIELDRALPAGEAVEILLEAEKRPVPWLEAREEEPPAFREIGLPELRVVGADEVEGMLGILASADLEVLVADLSADLQPVAGEGDRVAGEQANGTVLQYRYQDQAELAGRLQVRRRVARVAAETLAFVRLERGQLDVHYQLDLDIRGGELRQLRLALPTAIGDSLQVTAVDSPARVREQRPLPGAAEAESEDAERLWQIVLDRPVSGELTLAVDFSRAIPEPGDGAGDRALPDGEAGDGTVPVAPVPVLVVQDVVRQSGRVAVEAASDQQIDFRTRGLRDLDPAGIADPAAYQPQQRIVAAYQYARLPYQLELVATRHPTAPVLDAVCPAAEIVTVVGAAGRSHHRARFWVRSRQTQQVPIRLPEVADLWSVMVDSQPIEVRLRGSEYLVPLPAAADRDGDGTRELTLVYETAHPVPRFGRLGLWRWNPSTRQTAPEIGLTTLQTTWYIQTPDGTDLVSSRGDFRLEEPFRRWALATRLAETIGHHSTRGLGLKFAGLGLAGLIVGFYGLVTARKDWRKRMIEVLVVTGGLVLLVLLLLPATQTAREAARRSQCYNNLRQLGLALHNYHEEFGQFPPAAIGPHDVPRHRQFSWIVALLPYLEQSNLYQRLRRDLPWDHPHNRSLLGQTHLSVLSCPSDPSPRTPDDEFQKTGYVAVTGAATTTGPGSTRGVIDFDRGLSFREITDGTSNTLAIGEVIDGGPWFAAGSGTARSIETWIGNRNWSHHPGGGTFLLADGSVQWFSYHVQADVLRAAATAQAGDVVRVDASRAPTTAVPRTAPAEPAAEMPADMAPPAADVADWDAEEPADELEMIEPDSEPAEGERPEPAPTVEPPEEELGVEPPEPVAVPVTRGDRARLSLLVDLLPHGEPAFRFRRDGGAGEVVLGLQDRTFARCLQVLLVAAAVLVAWLTRWVAVPFRAIALVLGLALPIGLAGLLPLAWAPVWDGLLLGTCFAAGLWIMTGLLSARAVPPFGPSATALALVAAWLVAGPAVADAPSADPPATPADREELSEPDLTLFIPYDLDRGPPLQSTRAYLAREDFLRLWRQAHPQPPPAILPDPCAFVSHAEFTGRLVNERAHFEGQLVVHHLGDGWQRVILPLGEVALDRVQIDGRAATLADEPPGGGPPAIYVQKPGRHLVDLRFEVPVDRLGATGRMSLPLRPVPAGVLRFQLPAADLEVQVDGAAGGWRQELPEGEPEGSLLVIPLGAEGDMTVQWQPPHLETQEGLLARVDQTTHVLVRDSGVHLRSDLHYQIQQGSVRQLRLRIPPGIDVLDVRGEDVADWSIESDADGEAGVEDAPALLEDQADANDDPEADESADAGENEDMDEASDAGESPDTDDDPEEAAAERWLVVRLKTERSTSTDLAIDAFHGRVLESGGWPLRALEPLGVVRETGRVVVAAAPPFGVRVQDVQGLEQIDRRGLEPSEVAGPDLSLLAAYRYTTRPWRMELQVDRLRPELEVFDRTAVQVDRREVAVHSLLTARVTVAPIASLSLRLPALLRVSELQAPEGADWFLERDQEGQQLTIRLDQPQMGSLEISVRGEMPRDESRPEFHVPGMRIPGAAVHHGQLAVYLDEDWQAMLTDAGGARPLDPSELDAALREVSDRPADYAFHYESAGEPVQLALTEAPSRLIGQVTTVVSVREGAVAYLSNVDLEIRQAARSRFQLVTPHWLGPDVELRGAHLRQVHSETDGSQRTWQIQLQQPVRGTYRLQVVQTLPLPDDRTLRAAFVRPLDVERLQHHIVLENLTADEIVPRTKEGVAPISLGAAPESLAETVRRQATAAYRVSEDQAVLVWERRVRELQAGLQATIPLVDLTTVIHRDGRYRAQAVYRIRNFTLQFLEVELPVHSQAWSVRVADQPVRPATSDEPGAVTLLLPLQRTSAGDFSFDVVLVYGGHLGHPLRNWSHAQVPVPQIRSDVPVSRTLWTVYLPDEYRVQWVDGDSNLERVAAGSLHEERQRSFLDELREIVQVAGHAGESAARSKAYWNLQQLGTTLQDYAQPRVRRAERGPADVQQQAQQIEAEIRQLERIDRESERLERGTDFYFRKQAEDETPRRARLPDSAPQPRDELRQQAVDQLIRLKGDPDQEPQPAAKPEAERSAPVALPIPDSSGDWADDHELAPVGTAHHFRKLHGDPRLALRARHQEWDRYLTSLIWAGFCLLLAAAAIRGLTRPKLAKRVRRDWPIWALVGGVAWLFLLPAAILGWLLLVMAACVLVARTRHPRWMATSPP